MFENNPHMPSRKSSSLKDRIEKALDLNPDGIIKVSAGNRIFIVCRTAEFARSLEGKLEENKINVRHSVRKHVVIDNTGELEAILSGLENSKLFDMLGRSSSFF